MRVKIYQINTDRDVGHHKFLSLKNGQLPDASAYDEVFDAEIQENTLEAIYTRFNTEHHPLFRGHSLSVSDVVSMNGKAYCCQSVGFVEVPFDESETTKPDNLMRVVYVEPNKPPYMAEIEHTLEAEQKAVQGLIEVVYPHNGDDVCFICNEEGKLIGMEGNRTIHDGNTILAGPFFICGLTEDDFRGLTDEEVTKYMEVFKEPEQISQAEVEADMGYTIISGI